MNLMADRDIWEWVVATTSEKLEIAVRWYACGPTPQQRKLVNLTFDKTQHIEEKAAILRDEHELELRRKQDEETMYERWYGI